MFAGHTGFALLARRARPTIPFVVLFVAAYLPDLIEIGLRAARTHADPVFWSHALVVMAAQGAIMGLLTLAIWRDPRGALVVALAVLSHWPADVLTGMDKPTWAGGPTFGLLLYDHHLADFLVEGALLALGWFVARPAFGGVMRRLVAAGVAALILVQGAFALRTEDPTTAPAGKGDLLRTLTNAMKRVTPR